MKNTINFGIDLGTTNSAIAKYEDGEVVIFKNPLNLKQTLPSVVAFRKNRRVVGDKARELMQKDPANVVGGFKRKMGTSDSYFIDNLDDTITAEGLSAHVLKELKNFIHTGENLEAVVVTIPASFDTMQSNATKNAGFQAGFKQVVLLQEPIAASLAYANKGTNDLEDEKWLVYDLGGGTFDVALVSIEDDEMRVLDHEGNNYLGGTDFDKMIIEKFIIPALEDQGGFKNLDKEMKSASGKYNKLYNLLQIKAEEAKIQLTNSPTAEIEFETEDDTGEEQEFYLVLKREDFNQMIQPAIDDTVRLINEILERNHLTSNDLKFILMVGGSTYIPAVREQLNQKLGLEVNCNIDPTTAVAIGAAYYAGMKPLSLPSANESQKAEKIVRGVQTDLIFRTAYSKATQDTSTPFIAVVQGDISDKFYRITRSDGGFDSGLNPLKNDITEYLPLVEGVHNQFTFKVFDQFNNPIETGVGTIGIMHGKFSIDGQPLPHDICLEIDSLEDETTALEPIFKRNSVLPLKKTFVKEVSRHISVGSDDSIVINVLEGPLFSLPSANKTIGFIKISGHDLTRDLIKGSDVELTFEMSESRDLTVQVYLSLNDQEFERAFSPSVTTIDLLELRQELKVMKVNLTKKLTVLEQKEDYSGAGSVQKLTREVEVLINRIENLQDDDVTDEKYQIDDAKRDLARRMYAHFNASVLKKALEKYFETKSNISMAMQFSDLATEADRASFDNIVKDENVFLKSDSVSIIRMKIKQIEGLWSRVSSRKATTNEDIIGFFHYVRTLQYRDKTTANGLINQGEKALSAANYGGVLDAANRLYEQFQRESKDDDSSFKSSSRGLK